MSGKGKTHEELERELEELRARLQEAEEILRAIRSGEVDAVVVSGPQGEQVFTLKGADHPYRLLVEEMKEGAATLTGDGTILYCNGRLAQMLGTPLEKVIGSSIHRFVEERDRPLVQALLQQASDGGAGGELTLGAEDGARTPVILSVRALQLDDVPVLCAVATDLTEQKRHEEIVAAERLARSILDQAAEAIVVCDEKGRIIRASHTARELCGLNPMLQAFDAVFPLQVVAQQSQLAPEPFSLTSVLRGEQLRGIEARLTRRGGQLRDLFVSATPLLGAQERILGCVVTLVDITERQRVEERLRWELAVSTALAELSQGLLAPSPSVERVASIVLDYAKRLTESEHGFVSSIDPGTLDSVVHTLTSMREGECRVADEDGRIVFPIGPDGRYPALWGHALNTREAFYTNSPAAHEASQGVPKGHIALRNFLAVPAVAGDEIVGLVALANSDSDYTERDLDAIKRLTELYALAVQRNRVEEQLREEKAFTESVLHAVVDTVFVFDPNTGKALRWNKAMSEVSGYSDEEIAAKKAPDEWYSKEDLEKTKEERAKLLRGETSVVEMSLITKDGRSIPTEYTASMIKDSEGAPQYIIAVGRDITDRKRAEEVRELSRRLLEIGTRHTEMKPLLREYAAEVRSFTGCAAVGIRLLDEDGSIPYEAYEGFSREFYQKESPLSIRSDHCMCINVVKGQTDPKLPFYTEGGSFYMNGTTRFLATVSEEQKGSTRNECNRVGYESVALVPIGSADRILGLIHVADPRENRVPLEAVRTLEAAASQLVAPLERIRAQEALMETHQLLETVLGHTHVGIASLDPQFNFIRVNRAYAEADEREAAFFPGRNHFDLYPSGENEAIFRRVVETGQPYFAFAKPFEYAEQPERGVSYWDWGLAPIQNARGTVTGLVLTLEDVTDRHRAEEALRHRAEFEDLIARMSTRFINLAPAELDGAICQALQELGEFSGVDRCFVVQFGADFRTASCTHEWCAEGLQPPAESLGTVPMDGVRWAMGRHKRGEAVCVPRTADLPQGAAAEKERLQRLGIQSLLCVPMTCRDQAVGAVAFASVRQEKTWPEDTVALFRIVGEIFANALERQRAEEALRESEEQYRTLVERANDGIVIAQGERLAFVSRRLAEMLGYTVAEMSHTSFRSYVPPKEEEALLERYRRRMAGEDAPTIYETVLRRKDNTHLHVEINAGLIGYRGRPADLVLVRDITDRVRAEEQILDLARFPGENPNPVLRISKRGSVLYGNNASTVLLEAWDCGHGQLVPAHWRQCVQRAIDSGRKQEAEIGCGARTFLLTFAPVAGPEHVNVYALDITERTRFREELLALNRTLEARVEKRTALVKLLQDTADIANEAISADQAFRKALDRIRRHLGWVIAHAWRVEVTDPQAIVDTGVWSVESPRRFKRFMAETPQERIGPDTCIVGRAAASGKPEWIADIRDEGGCPHCSGAADLGLRTSLATPILVGHRAVGVLEFFSEEPADLDEQLLQVMTHVGAQLGQVVERQSLQEQLIEAVWKEEREFGQELHDGLCQQLAGVAMLARGLKQGLEARAAPEAGVAGDLSSASEEAKQKLLELSRSLLPFEVDAGALVWAMERLVANTEALYGITCTFECSTPAPALADATANHLFRIGQEAVQNAARHGGAKNIAVTMEGDAGWARLKVRDDGVGIDPGELTRATGIGLRIMRYRAQVIGAALEIRPGRGGGTVVTCQLDL